MNDMGFVNHHVDFVNHDFVNHVDFVNHLNLVDPDCKSCVEDIRDKVKDERYSVI